MRVLLTLLFLIATIECGFSQGNEPEMISKEDSVQLADTWKNLMPYLFQKRISTTAAIADSLYCDLCIKENQSMLDARMDKASFRKNGLPIFNQHKKIKATIESEQPGYGMIVYENENFSVRPVWVVSYNYWKPDELAKGHEGATVLFEFRKSANGFELFQISTIP